MTLAELVKAMSLEEAQTRLADIEALLADEESEIENIDELNEEVGYLIDHINTLQEEGAQEQRSAILSVVRNGAKANTEAGNVVRTFKEEERMSKVYTLDSPEYRSAVFNTLLENDLNKEERAAYDAIVTAGSGNIALPTTVMDEVMSNIETEHAILGDMKLSQTGTVLEVTVVKSIKQGKAGKVKEGEANDSADYETAVVKLTGENFSEFVELSYAAGKMTAGKLEQYFKQEISDRLGEAIATYVIEQITAKINAENKIGVATAGELTYDELTAAMSLLKGKGPIYVYSQDGAFYKGLVGMVNKDGTPVFAPGTLIRGEGALVGATVRTEDAVGDNKILIGKPAHVVGNFVQDILVENDRDIKKSKHIIAGYCNFDAALTNDKAFVEIDLNNVVAGAAAKAAAKKAATK